MQTIDELDRELQQQTVAVVCGRTVSRADLTAAFDKVAPANNWKMPIDATVSVADDFELMSIHEAIEFFTGGIASAMPVSAGVYRFRAPGYYASVGT